MQVLKQCGDDLTRDNVMKQAASLKSLTHPMLLPGITINTSATDFAPIKQMQMQKFNGERWELFGPIMTGDVGQLSNRSPFPLPRVCEGKSRAPAPQGAGALRFVITFQHLPRDQPDAARPAG